MSESINIGQLPKVASVPASEFSYVPSERDRARRAVVIRKVMAMEYDRGWWLPMRQRAHLVCASIPDEVAT